MFPLNTGVFFIPCKVHAPTGPVDRDYDDVRRYSDAAMSGIKRYFIC